MSILAENWHTWYIGDAHSKSRFRFLKFRPQNSFWANLGPKIQICPFSLKIGAHRISRMLIPNPDLDYLKFWSHNLFLGKFGPKNLNLSVLSENWYSYYFKDTDSESRLRFLKFWSQNPFFDKFGPKNSKLSVLYENWYTWYLKDADSYFNISFLNFKS